MYYKLLQMLLVTCLFSTSAVAEGISREDIKGSIREVPAVVIKVIENEVKDPIEGFNRGVYTFNDTIDKMFLSPVARGYRFSVPDWGRQKVSNVVDNLSSPMYFANSLLQGDIEGAFTSFWRFVINSTLGIGGLHDVAAEAGLKPKREDFGQTLAVYGFGSGPYMVVPIIGPTNPRDLVGTVFDSVTNPFSYLTTPASISIKVAEIITKREHILDYTDDVEEESFDPYSTIKSAYTQRRNREIANDGGLRNEE